MVCLPVHDDFVPSILAGSKCTTIRRGRRDYPIGDCLLQSKTCNIPVIILGLRYCSVVELSDDDARHDGLADRNSLLFTLQRFYPDLTLSDVVTVVEFRKGITD